MNLSLLTLAGITLSTICASICPMNVGMMSMSMDMGEMHMAAQEINHDMQGQQDCETCDKKSEDIAFLGLSLEIQQAAYTFNVLTSSVIFTTDTIHIEPQRLFLSNVGPPPLSQSLVGTVIFRT